MSTLPTIAIIGERGHAARLRALIEHGSSAQLCAVYHPQRVPAHALGTCDFGRVLKSDGVIIASPDATHVDYVRKLRDAGYGGYLYVEKIPAVSAAELSELRARLDERIVFGFALRFSPLSRALQHWVDSGVLGRPLALNIVHGYGIAHRADYASSWRAQPLLTPGGPLQVLGIHFIELADRLLGPLRGGARVAAHVATTSASSPDTCSVLLAHDRDASTQLVVSYAVPAIDQFTLLGTDGWVQGDARALKRFGPRDHFTRDGRYQSPPECESMARADDDFAAGLVAAIEHFVSLIARKGSADPSEQQRALRANACYCELQPVHLSALATARAHT